MRKLVVACVGFAVFAFGPHAEALATPIDVVIDDLFDGTYGTPQSVTKKIKRGKSAVFELAFQNDDAALPDTLTVDGCASSKGFTVTYIDAAGDATAAISNGTYTIPALPAGGEATATMSVKVKKRGPKVKDCAVSATSSAPAVQDTVHGVVKVKRTR